jgi:branched-chain amino acid aminotransferase
MRIYIDHRFVDEKKAVVSVFDHGFLYGDGVFETLRAYHGRLLRMEDHLTRLKNSAQNLKISMPYTPTGLGRLLNQTIKINHLKNALIRIAITRGYGPIGLDPALCRKPTVVIIPRNFPGYPSTQYTKGLTVAIVSVRRIPPQALDPRIKSMNFLNNILTKVQAKENHADEGLMLTLEGYLAEGSISNLFFIKHGRIYTPAVSLGILAGITRQMVLDLAKEARIPVKEGRFIPLDIYRAEECFLTNTSMEIMPAVKIDGIRIGNGKPGSITRFLLEAYRKRVRFECGII